MTAEKPDHASAAAQAEVARRIVEMTSRWAQGATLAEIRGGFEELLAGPEPGRAESTTLAGMAAVRHRPAADAPRGCVLFCHGGGFQIGSLRSHASLMARLAEASGTEVIGFDYRLAPEHRFPAQMEDGVAAYRAVLAANPHTRIVIAGDSAGGNLALTIALQARDAGLTLPAALVLISPWLDLTMRGESYQSRAEKDIFSKPEALRAMARTYLGRGGDPLAPLASPVNADLAGLPPILVHAGDFDITLDDSTLLAQRAKQVGVDCTLRVWPEMGHHFQVFDALPQARSSIADIGVFIREAVR